MQKYKISIIDKNKGLWANYTSSIENNNYQLRFYSSVAEFKRDKPDSNLLIIKYGRKTDINVIRLLKDLPLIFIVPEADFDLYNRLLSFQNLIPLFADSNHNYFKILAGHIKKQISSGTENKVFENQDFLLRMVLDNSPIVLYYIDKQGIIRFSEGNVLPKIKLEKNKIIGKSIFELYKDNEQVLNFISSTFEGNVNHEISLFNDLYFDSWCVPVMDQQGIVQGVIGLSIDISKRVLAEEELKKSKYLINKIINNSPLAIFSLDSNGIFQLSAGKLLNEIGIEAEKLIGNSVFKGFRDIGNTTELFIKALNGMSQKKIINYNNKYLDFWFSPYQNDFKQIAGVVGSISDITDIYNADLILKENEELYRTLAKNLPNVAVLLFDKNLRYKIAQGSSINLKELQNYVGKTIWDILPKDAINSLEPYYRATLEGHRLSFERSYGEYTYLVNMLPVKNEKEQIFAGMVVFQDITEQKNVEKKLKASLKEKEVLLKEIHHRVKNNLQVISSLLNLQSSYINEKRIKQILKESQSRVKTMALIHEKLYQTETISNINFSEYLNKLVNYLYQSYYQGNNINFRIKAENIYFDLEKAIPLGLLINEVLSNSLKYAFENQKNGEIFIIIKNKGLEFELIVGDNGVGLPDNFDFRTAKTLGMQLIISLAEQLEGQINLERNKGTKYIINFR